VLAAAGLLEALARWFACHRSLGQGGGGGEVAVFARRHAGGGASLYRYAAAPDPAAELARHEARSVAHGLRADGFPEADWEACLPQITTALVDHAPSRAAVASSAHRSLLTFSLRDALLARLAASPELALKCCWLLKDALADADADADAFGEALFRECWAAASAAPEAADAAAFVGALVRVSEHLAKIERTRRRAPELLRPMLRALNDWLAPRALRGGVALPLYPCGAGATLRVLRIVAEACEVMPSRARAPTLLYCEAIASLAAGVDEAPPLNVDAEARRWRGVVHARGHAPPFDVVDSFLNVGAARLDFEKARRSELLARVFGKQVWEAREADARARSPYGSNPGWRLCSFLVKADDELRREQLAMQLAGAVKAAFTKHGVGARAESHQRFQRLSTAVTSNSFPKQRLLRPVRRSPTPGEESPREIRSGNARVEPARRNTVGIPRRSARTSSRTRSCAAGRARASSRRWRTPSPSTTSRAPCTTSTSGRASTRTSTTSTGGTTTRPRRTARRATRRAGGRRPSTLRGAWPARRSCATRWTSRTGTTGTS